MLCYFWTLLFSAQKRQLWNDLKVSKWWQCYFWGWSIALRTFTFRKVVLYILYGFKIINSHYFTTTFQGCSSVTDDKRSVIYFFVSNLDSFLGETHPHYKYFTWLIKQTQRVSSQLFCETFNMKAISQREADGPVNVTNMLLMSI